MESISEVYPFDLYLSFAHLQRCGMYKKKMYQLVTAEQATLPICDGKTSNTDYSLECRK
jgi:hypothetical protein